MSVNADVKNDNPVTIKVPAEIAALLSDILNRESSKETLRVVLNQDFFESLENLIVEAKEDWPHLMGVFMDCAYNASDGGFVMDHEKVSAFCSLKLFYDLIIKLS